MTLKKLKIVSKQRKLGRKGQTALEYALVVAAISLVIMAAWNVVGDQVKSSIEGSISRDIRLNLDKGNATVRKN